MSTFVLLLSSAISFSAIFLYGCVGEIITEKSGHLNLGIPGIMCSGTAGGCLGVALYMGALKNPDNPSYIMLILIGVLMAFIFAAFVGSIYGVLTVYLKCNQNITGLALTTFGAGFTQFIMDNSVKRENFPVASTFISKSLPFAKNLGAFGEIFLSHGLLVYLAIAIAIAAAIVLKKTKVGLRLRAVGENPAAADAVGINVSKYKFLAILIGSGIAGLGGFFYTMDYVQGTYENYATIESFGWLAIALVIFAVWRPNIAIFGSILFGALYILPNVINVKSSAQAALISLIPYVVTAVVLLVISITGSKSVQPPASLGLNYFREER